MHLKRGKEDEDCEPMKVSTTEYPFFIANTADKSSQKKEEARKDTFTQL